MAFTTILTWDLGTVFAAVAIALLMDKLRHVTPRLRPWEAHGTTIVRRSRPRDFALATISEPGMPVDREDWFGVAA